MKIIYLDTETTGVDAKLHSLHQVSLIYEDTNTYEEWDYKIRPWANRVINDAALEKGQIKLDTIMKYPEQSEVFRSFKDLLNSKIDPYNKNDKAFLIGFNVGFDEQFIREWFNINNDSFYGSYFWTPSIDVMTLAANRLMLVRNTLPNFKLETVCDYFKIKASGQQHEGMNDTRMCRSLYKMVK